MHAHIHNVLDFMSIAQKDRTEPLIPSLFHSEYSSAEGICVFKAKFRTAHIMNSPGSYTENFILFLMTEVCAGAAFSRSTDWTATFTNSQSKGVRARLPSWLDLRRETWMSGVLEDYTNRWPCGCVHILTDRWWGWCLLFKQLVGSCLYF